MYISKKVTVIKKRTFFTVFLVPFLFFVSYFLVKSNRSGDQIAYRNYYIKLKDMDMIQAIESAPSLVGSFEPLTSIILWVGASSGFPKDIYISLFNVILILSLFFFLNKYKAPWYVYLLIFTNFYLFALLTTLDRLKMAYILYVLIPLFPKNKILIGSLSPLAHLQSFIIIIPHITNKILESLNLFISKLKLNKSNFTFLIISFILIVIGFSYLKDPLVNKFLGYFDGEYKIIETKNLIFLSFIWLYLSKYSFKTIITISILFILVIILGSFRMNMIIFTLFFYQGILNGYYRNVLFNIVLFYFSLKSILFLYNLFEYGDGYVGYLI